MRAVSLPRAEAYVSARFDALADRFKASVGDDDVRLRAVLDALPPLPGLRILDLGCGQGRFGRHLQGQGAVVVGLDSSQEMLARATGLGRARGTARRVPFAAGTFDAVVAIEVLEHVGPIEGVLAEVRRVLRPGGRFLLLDKNAAALDPIRPWLPAVAVKRLDEWRGRWMYPAGAPVRERWFWPGRLRAQLERDFEGVRIGHLLTPLESRRAVFRHVPAVRRFVLWTADRPGGADA